MQFIVRLQRELEKKVRNATTNSSADGRIVTAMGVLVSSTFFSKTADTLASPKIVLTALLQSMGASPLAISALVPLRESGSLLPQIWLAGFVNRCQRLNLIYAIGALIQGLAAVGMVLSAWLLEGQLAGWSIVACVATLSVARALCSISFKGVLGICVPSGLRGQTTGWASSAAGVATVIIAIALWSLSDYDTVNVLATFLGLAAICWWVAAGLFAHLNEHNDLNQSERQTTMMERLSLLREQPSFRHFILVRSLLVSTALVAPWYVMLSVSANAALGSVGSLLLASGLASFISSPFWGRYSDRSSRWVLQVSALGVTLLGFSTVALYWLLPDVLNFILIVPLLYCALQVAHQGVRVARKTHVVDLANDGNRVDFVSISNTLIGFIILLMGVVSGMLSIWLPPIGMIAIFSIMSGIGAWTASSLPEAQRSN